MKAAGLIFDMDGTMVDSMPFHAKSWSEFTRRHGIAIGIDELLRRTTGRNGVECMRELFDRELAEEQAVALVDEKEAIYRDLFAPVFAEVRGFRSFARGAMARGLKVAVGTAGDRHNIDFVFTRLKMDPPPHAVVGGDEGLPGKPEPAIFLEAARRIGVDAAQCIVFEDAPLGIEAARRAGMRAVAICSSHSAAELSGSHVIAQARDFEELITTNFLESLDA
jgi:beta-phosphoglucomutase-like phosphatase (HAD superfamily)